MMRIPMVLVMALMIASCGGDRDADRASPPDRTPTVTTGGDAIASPSRPPAPGTSGGDFDVETWRQETISRFGPEKTYQDGSKFDYVEAARELCATEDRPDYEEGSLQRYIEETFCPYD